MKIYKPKRPRPSEFIDIQNTERRAIQIGRAKAKSMFPDQCFCRLDKQGYLGCETNSKYVFKFDVKDDIFASEYFYMYMVADNATSDFIYYIGKSNNTTSIEMIHFEKIEDIKRELESRQVVYHAKFIF